MECASEREAVAAATPELATLTPGRTGNLSVRRGDRVVVTPTGVAYDQIEPSDVSVVTLDGDHIAGLDPSSETPMHRRLYQTTAAEAIVHTHSPWATTLAVARQPLPPVHYMLAHAGGEVPVADYATYGTPALAEEAAATMAAADTEACLLANHGLVAVGESVSAALETTVAVESTARLYCQASARFEPVTLDEAELDRVAAKFADYGQTE